LANQTVRNDTSYSYFDNGWVKSSTDPWDIVTTYGYNDVGQQTARTVTSAGGSSSRTMSWGFFPDGKLKSRSDDGVPVGLHVSLIDNSDIGDVGVTGTWATATAGAGHVGTDYRTHAAATGSADRFTWKGECPSRWCLHGVREISDDVGCVDGGAVHGDDGGRRFDAGGEVGEPVDW
jgi:hypothetical protein